MSVSSLCLVAFLVANKSVVAIMPKKARDKRLKAKHFKMNKPSTPATKALEKYGLEPSAGNIRNLNKQVELALKKQEIARGKQPVTM